MKKKYSVIIAIVVILIIGLIVVKVKNNVGNQEIKIENVIKVPSHFNKVYRIREIEFFKNITNPKLMMLSCKVIFTEKVDKKGIENNLKAAIVELYNAKNKPHRILVYAYGAEDNINGDYTIAEASFVPKKNFDLTKDNLKDYILEIKVK